MNVARILQKHSPTKSHMLWITLVANTSARFALAKGQELLRFFFDDMG